MYTWDAWSYRWFGWWREADAQTGVSIYSFVDTEWQLPEPAALLAYLRDCPAPVACPMQWENCIFGGRACLDQHSLEDGDWLGWCVRSDGVFIWPADLAHYVQRHNVRIPDAILRHVISRDFVPPVEVSISWDEVFGIMRTIPLPGRVSFLRTKLRRYVDNVRGSRNQISRRQAGRVALDTVRQMGYPGRLKVRRVQKTEVAGPYYVRVESDRPVPATEYDVYIDATTGAVEHFEDVGAILTSSGC